MGPLVPRPVISVIALGLLMMLPFQIYLDASSETYDGAIGTLVIGGLLAGICGFELVVGLIRRGGGGDEL